MTSLIIQQVFTHVLGYTQSAGNFGTLYQQRVVTEESWSNILSQTARRFLFLSILCSWFQPLLTSVKTGMRTFAFIGVRRWTCFQSFVNGAAITSQTAKLSLGKDKVITEILPEEREVGGLGSAPPDLPALATVFIKWNASINEGLIRHLPCCFAQQHYLSAPLIASLDLAGDAPWQSARLKVCLPAYCCNFFLKLLA